MTRPPTRHPLRAVMIIGTAMITLMLAGATLMIFALRSSELENESRSLSTLNTVLAEEAGRAIQGVEIVLASLVDKFRTNGIDTEEQYRVRTSDAATHEILRDSAIALPQIEAITLIASNGDLINFSRFFPIPSVNVADRDYFAALARVDTGQPFISEPVRNRGTGARTVYLARRMPGPDGRFLGLVLAAIDLRYFQDFYASLDLPNRSAIGLWRTSGQLLTRQPPWPETDRAVPSSVFGGLTALRPARIIDDDARIDGDGRLVSIRRLKDYSLVIVASRMMSEVLEDWRRQSLVLAIVSVLASLGVVVVMVALVRQFGAYEAVAAAVRDREKAIVARVELEAQLRQSQKLEAMGQLTSGVAHDFNNFLTVVIGNLEMLARNLAPTDASARRFLDGALAGAERATSLTKRLLAFSRRQPLVPAHLDVNLLVTGLADILRQTLVSTIVLRFDLAPDLWPIFADANQLESALLNLVVNARDAMGERGSVTISTRNVPADTGEATASDDVLITIADTGAGMTADVLRHAFDPFFTTKAPGVGTGLGLAQVHGFVVQSKGRVTVDSEVGRGTVVSLRLPRSVAMTPRLDGAAPAVIEDDVARPQAAAPLCDPVRTSS